jgi:DNA repair photolyase
MFGYTESMDALRGRGTPLNPANRFEEIARVRDEDAGPDEGPAPATRVFRDASRSILARNDSPDIPFTWSLNPYRGCEHGCVYCYARPYHEYLGLSSGLDFETMIFAKEDAAALLSEELARKSWVPDTIALGGVTDCYQPAERALKITRSCLEVLADARNPCGLVTKNALVTRDLDLFQELARWGCARVFVTLTTLDPDLARRLEPRACAPGARLRAIETLAAGGVPVGVMAAPMILGLNDHELPAILEAAAAAGARHAAYIPLRLPHQLGTLFEDWLERHYPERKAKVLSQIRAIRGGRLNDPSFGARMTGVGVFAEHLRGLFALTARRLGLNAERLPARVEHFRRPSGPQLRLL